MGISTMTLDPVDLFDSYLSRSQAAGLFLVWHEWPCLMLFYLKKKKLQQKQMIFF